MDVSIMEAAPAQRARYRSTNAQWPTDIPQLTHAEAERAYRRLWRKFGNRTIPARRKVKLRRVWVPSKPPFDRLSRGWRRLIHDVSHRIARHLYPGKRPHDWRHEHLERDITAYVLAQGWLTGKLKPKEKPKTAATPDLRYQRVLAGLKRWEAKQRRAETALKKLARQRAYYEKKLAA